MLITSARSAARYRRLLSSSPSYLEARASRSSEVNSLVEIVELERFHAKLASGELDAAAGAPLSLADAKTDAATFELALRAGFATLALHTEARVASLLGYGFYTIGPCGEELLAAVGLVLRGDDAMVRVCFLIDNMTEYFTLIDGTTNYYFVSWPLYLGT